MASAMRIVFGLLTLVTCGMILGALIQLAFIHRMEDSLDRESSFGGKHASLAGNKHPLARGISYWGYDKEAVALRIGYVKPEIISWKPRIILFHNFLSAEECDYLRSVAMPRLHVSTVVDAKTGKFIPKIFCGYLPRISVKTMLRCNGMSGL